VTRGILDYQENGGHVIKKRYGVTVYTVVHGAQLLCVPIFIHPDFI
jgi:hypothetical protein